MQTCTDFTLHIITINHMYSQNHEDDIILKYFKSKVYPLEITKHEFTLLEIGANDGKTFSKE